MTLTLGTVFFYVLAAVTLAGALGAVTLRNIAHALLGVVVFFFGIASLFFLLHADFLGVVQILVYVGAVAVLIVFAIVLTRATESPTAPAGGSLARTLVGAAAAALTGAVLVVAVVGAPAAARVAKTSSATAEDIGRAMMTTYVVPFELASILLTAALIGAVAIAVEERKS